jgi:hypothetical protein
MSDALRAPGRVQWYYRPGWVLLLLFVVLGPLALRNLWKSPCFSRRMKIVLTVLELVFLAVGISEGIRVFRAVQEQMRALEGMETF